MEIEFESERRRLLESERRRFESDQQRHEEMQRKAEEHEAYMERLRKDYKAILNLSKADPHVTEEQVAKARNAWLSAMEAHRKPEDRKPTGNRRRKRN